MIRKILLTTLLACLATQFKSNAQIENNSITVSFAGDCTLGEYNGQGGGNLFRDYYKSNGADWFFSGVQDVFKNDGLTFINLEGAFSDTGATAKKKFPIYCETEHINTLTNSSIEVVNLSNNHIYDCGKTGYENTKSLLSSNNIGYCGEGNTYTVDKNGFKVTFLGYQGWSDSKQLRNSIKKDIETAKTSGSNLVFVEFHWGIERDNLSNKTQENLGRYAIDSGADVVVGSHPHVIQGIELYNGKPIVYSLGNFSFGANKNPKDKDTFIFQARFKDDWSVSYDVIPCRISSQKNKNDYKPTILDGEDKDKVLGRLQKYSSKYEATLDWESMKIEK